MSYGEEQKRVEQRLRVASMAQRTLFAASVADRWFRAEQAPDGLEWADLLDAVWMAAAGDQTAHRRISDEIGRYHLSEHSHNEGQNGTQDFTEQGNVAVLFAALHYLYESADFAVQVSDTGVQAADWAAQDEEQDPEEAAAAEVARQHRHLDILDEWAPVVRYAETGLDVRTINRVEDELLPLLR
ncbi:hypothetical protein [Actinoplanes couchii]|uniref:Uncharacterized protein n=1 Tax=Actinoplanes couchii TaxID=403638 RepID=A0ABQ3XDI9_9ACTN|nr:hypothetical protein [Actinoplanes couchii]MDR6321350.1 hypothetical protein [Actinoplanes couchii]GID56460.1 hypothetical protein Aco03nite_048640 [Actinoplanes couchii]